MTQTIQYQSFSARFNHHFELQAIDWQLEPGQHWVLLGGNGAGKSALAASLVGEGEALAGHVSGLPAQVAWVSFEAQEALIEAERKKDDADILDVISEGTPVHELLAIPGCDPALQERLVAQFGFAAMLNQGFRELSTGETRKLLLMRALLSQPDLLVLDEPFDGLDAASQQNLHRLLAQQAAHMQMVLVLNRLDEMPDFITHMAYLESGRLCYQAAQGTPEAAEIQQLLHLKTSDLHIPATVHDKQRPALATDAPLVRLRQARVAYTDKVVFAGLDWTIWPGEHWQVTGPNGSGKTCLLNLISGDHPQCYNNDIQVFGMQRGTGESIWQVKQYIGYVSSALQWEYRVSINVRNVIISGFYDSIGLYQQYSAQQKRIADQWLALLALLGLSKRATQAFSRLSFGERRLVLIARAMVKHPPLLILDEPCLGLDELNRQLVLALIERICAGSETTVLYVNHHAEDKIAGIERYVMLGNQQASIKA